MSTIPIPAATLVIFRDRAGLPPEILMVERAKAMAFAGGAMVFPGGRVDPADRALAALNGTGDDDTAARIAAIRETIEEAGVAIGLDPPPADLPAFRAALHAGQTLAELLHAENIRLHPDALIPFARWLPNHATSRIFDARFYLARLPEDAGAATVDRTENTRLVWITAAAMLAEADAGRASIIFPTRRNLERLACFASFDDAAIDAATYSVRAITPWSEMRDGVEHLCIPDDLGYPVTAEPLASAMRG